MINIEALRNVILENQQFVSSIKPICRDYDIEKNANYIFTGSRRAGKTWFMYDVMHRVSSKRNAFRDVLYINFEDERLFGFDITHFNLLLECYKSIYNTKPVLYLDEPQNIFGWEKFARRLADSEYRVYITGSNANMLSREIESTLGGRYLVKEISPLSFKEYLEFHKIRYDRNILYKEERFGIKKQFDEYFFSGGFPETLNFSHKREYLSNLFQKVLYGDIMTRNNIKNGFALKFIVKKMAESIHDETSFNRIKNLVLSTGAKIGSSTVIEYIEYMKDAFLISSVENYYSKSSDRESKKKYYFVDNGVLNLFLINPNTILLENLVYNNLYRYYSKDIYYLKNGYEIDFYLDDTKELIQVCYDLSDFETRKRELKAIKKSIEKVEVSSVKIITMDQKEIIPLGDFNIEVIPIWHWLLS